MNEVYSLGELKGSKIPTASFMILVRKRRESTSGRMIKIKSEGAMRREHRRPRIVGSVRLGGSSFVDSVLSCVVWRSAFVSCWFL